MKTLKVFFAALFTIVLMSGISARTDGQAGENTPQPNVKTESFKVWGKCGMCKTRIEKTVKAGGATNASWDEVKQMLTVTFDPSKTSKDALSKKLAAVGHDTELYKAPDDVYANLPGCCHYERLK
jgi:periplasmic mercuric ion binding protein